jgi:hypothetical protein
MSSSSSLLSSSFTPTTSLLIPPATPTPAPTSSSSSSQGSNDASTAAAASGALYLYTLLVVLVLLFSVGTTIIIRTFLRRRRRNRHVAEALANGTWTSGLENPGPKPTFFNAYLDVGKGGIDYVNEKDIDWQDILPFSVTPVKSPKDDHTAGANPPPIPSSRMPRLAAAFQRRSRRPTVSVLPLPVSTQTPRRFNPNVPPPPSPQQTSHNISPSPDSSNPSAVRVVVLIAMPSSLPRTPSNDDENVNLPPVEFGVAEVDLTVKRS